MDELKAIREMCEAIIEAAQGAAATGRKCGSEHAVSFALGRRDAATTILKLIRTERGML